MSRGIKSNLEKNRSFSKSQHISHTHSSLRLIKRTHRSLEKTISECKCRGMYLDRNHEP